MSIGPIVKAMFAAFVDSRVGGATVDGAHQGSGVVAAGSTYVLPVAGRGGIPAGAGAVVMNVTVTGTQGAGFLTLYPCDGSRPNASNLNFVAGQNHPELGGCQTRG